MTQNSGAFATAATRSTRRAGTALTWTSARTRSRASTESASTQKGPTPVNAHRSLNCFRQVNKILVFRFFQTH